MQLLNDKLIPDGKLKQFDTEMELKQHLEDNDINAVIYREGKEPRFHRKSKEHQFKRKIKKSTNKMQIYGARKNRSK